VSFHFQDHGSWPDPLRRMVDSRRDFFIAAPTGLFGIFLENKHPKTPTGRLALRRSLHVRRNVFGYFGRLF
jgi:hypothetical protein